MWHDADGMGWWMLWGSLMMVLFWGGLIALFVWGLQSFVRRDGPRDPLEIARERLARGEITPGQFDEIKEKLRS